MGTLFVCLPLMSLKKHLRVKQQLMLVKVPIISNTECRTFYSWIMGFHLCTHKQGTGHCSVDSGGPLFLLNDKNRHMVVGVCSFANNGDCTSTPGGFARLTLSVLQWIRSVKVNSWQH